MAKPKVSVASSESSTTTSQIPENLKGYFEGMTASVNSIAAAISSQPKTNETTQIVRVNVLHLDLMLSNEAIQKSKVNLSAFTKAVQDGKAYLSA